MFHVRSRGQERQVVLCAYSLHEATEVGHPTVPLSSCTEGPSYPNMGLIAPCLFPSAASSCLP